MSGTQALGSGGGAKILVVDDEASVTSLLCELLGTAGYQVVAANGGQEGLREFFRARPDLALLDIIMPKMDGLALATRIREVSDIPVIMLSARGQEGDKVEALGLGADDYIVKPVGSKELLARVAAALRRARLGGGAATQETYSDGEVTMDFSRHEVFIRGKAISLTRLEFRLLAALTRSAGQALTYDQLLDQVWGPQYDSPDYVTWHIGRLRRKVEQNPARPQRILTVRGVGYRYQRPSP